MIKDPCPSRSSRNLDIKFMTPIYSYAWRQNEFCQMPEKFSPPIFFCFCVALKERFGKKRNILFPKIDGRSDLTLNWSHATILSWQPLIFQRSHQNSSPSPVWSNSVSSILARENCSNCERNETNMSQPLAILTDTDRDKKDAKHCFIFFLGLCRQKSVNNNGFFSPWAPFCQGSQSSFLRKLLLN